MDVDQELAQARKWEQRYRETAAEEKHRREQAEAERDRLRKQLLDAVNGKDTAWRTVWVKLQTLGLESFVGGDGTGVGRATAFIESIAAERDEWKRRWTREAQDRHLDVEAMKERIAQTIAGGK